MEVSIFVLILLASLVFYIKCIKKKSSKSSNIHYVILSILILIALFIGIHLVFYFRVGFPASIDQEETNLVLSSGDWLSFLGGYLSFSGSLVMAFVVYRQSKKIDELTILEYEPLMSISIRSCNKSTEYSKGVFKENNIIQVLPADLEPFYTYHCDFKKTDKDPLFEEYSILLFVDIYNFSKSLVDRLSFESLVFTNCNTYKDQSTQSMDKNQAVYQYDYFNRGDDWDLLDKHSQILPGKKLKRCFLLNKIPNNLGICWMIIKFSFADSQPFEQKFLVSKNKGGMLTFLNISEPN